MNQTRNCKNRECRQEFRPFAGESVRYCRTCSRVKKQRKQEVKAERRKRVQLRPAKITGWQKIRQERLELWCESCGFEFTDDSPGQLDHIVPAGVISLLREKHPGIPSAERSENLMSLCRRHHAVKLQPEGKLCRGNIGPFFSIPKAYCIISEDTMGTVVRKSMPS